MVSFLKLLLEIDPDVRLSNCTPALIKENAFFEDIDWNSIESKSAIPPYKPTKEAYKVQAHNSSLMGRKFNECMAACGKVDWLETSESGATSPVQMSPRLRQRRLPMISDEDQIYFREWNYVSPQLIETVT